MYDMSISDFYCTRCGNKTIPIVRKTSRSREPGHLKKLWCPFCKEEVNCVEIRGFGDYNYNDFLCEYTNNNFDENGNRRQNWKELRREMNEKNNVYDDGSSWGR